MNAQSLISSTSVHVRQYHCLLTNHVYTIKAVCLKEITDLKISVGIPEVADYDDDFFFED